MDFNISDFTHGWNNINKHSVKENQYKTRRCTVIVVALYAFN